MAATVAWLLLGGVAAVAISADHATVLRQSTQQVRSNALGAARALDRQAEDFRRTVQASADSREMVAALERPSPGTLARATPALSILATSKNAPAAFLTDLAGRTVAVYPDQAQLIGKDFSYRDWFQGVSRTGRPYVSNAYQSAAAGHPMVVGVAAPVVNGGRRVGYLTALWELGSVRNVAAGTLRDDGVTLSVTDREGRPVLDSLPVDDRGQPQPFVVAPATRRALAGHPVSERSGGSLREVQPVPGLGWTVTASLPTSTAMAPAATFRTTLLGSLGMAGLLVLAGLVVALHGARRMAVERAVADEERHRLAALFAASPVGIIEGLPDGTILEVNPAFAAMVGYSREELLELRAGQLAHPSSAPEITGALSGVLDGSVSSYTSERVYRTASGDPLPALVSVVVLREEAGRLRRMVAFVVDLRQQKADERALQQLAASLREREEFLATLLDTVDVSVLACDAEGALTRVNKHARRLHALPDDAPIRDFSQLRIASPDGRLMPLARYPLLRALSEGSVTDADLLVLPEDGSAPRRVLAQARRLSGPGGEVTGAVVAAYDVTDLREIELALRASEERFRRIFDEGLTGKALVDASGRIVRANAVAAQLVGATSDQLVGRPLRSLLTEPSDQVRVEEMLSQGTGELIFECELAHVDGQQVWARVGLVWLSEPDGERVLLAHLDDVTARRTAEQRLTELALRDELTGLANRRLLMEQVERAFHVAASARGGSCVTALFIDLDGFKAVNDRAGHEEGDRLLLSIAQDLVSVLRPTDTVARVGGDEFVVLLGDDEGMTYVRSVADRIGTTVRRQVMADGLPLVVSASVGIARVDLAHEPGTQPEQLLRRADAAMYLAKERGRDRHEVFDDHLRAQTEARQQLEQGVRDGLSAGRLNLVFQPVVDVDSGLVIGAEALMRLTDREGHLLPTLPAILAAEHAGLAEKIGDVVLQQALEALVTWPAHMTVAVNVSARELTSRDFLGRVEQALRRKDVDPVRLVLEITESSILRAGPSALRDLERLRQRGVKVAIDDFGTAYATLQNLTVLPVDVLKVDASFTAGLSTHKTHTAVLHGIVSMAYELDVPCVIEGVETQAQVDALRGRSVHGQGWYWGKPQGAGVVPAVLRIPNAREGVNE